MVKSKEKASLKSKVVVEEKEKKEKIKSEIYPSTIGIAEYIEYYPMKLKHY